MKTVEKIIKYISENGQVSASNLSEYLGITDRAVRKQLKALFEKGALTKSGKPPKVFYSISIPVTKKVSHAADAHVIGGKARQVIEDNFYYISPTGKQLMGWQGFAEWCAERGQDPDKMSGIYLSTYRKYAEYHKNGLIDGTKKFKSTFKDPALDKVYYSDFYSIEIFGKTRLGQELLYSKQSQDRALMNQMIDKVKPTILSIMAKYRIDGVGYLPPTVRRERQLMKQIRQRLKLSARELNLVKIKTPIIVPQKTLSKLEDRIVNARETIVVDEGGNFNNILLIDDAVGSGATLNETAQKIRDKGICKGKIIGYAITGSAKGFEVISEV